MVDIGEAGRHSDGGVLSNSSFGHALESDLLFIPDASPLTGIAIRCVGYALITTLYPHS